MSRTTRTTQRDPVSKTKEKQRKKVKKRRPGEMAQWLRALTSLPEVISQQTSVMDSDALFWLSEDSDSVLTYIK